VSSVRDLLLSGVRRTPSKETLGVPGAEKEDSRTGATVVTEELKDTELYFDVCERLRTHRVSVSSVRDLLHSPQNRVGWSSE
jgi:hypothetical protein